MNVTDIVRMRLANQHLAGVFWNDPADVVRAFGAVQAQDYRGALWGIGLRTKAATEKQVEEAISRKKIVRTWPMRGTLHFVAPESVRWMLQYLTPRILKRAAKRHRDLEIDDRVIALCRGLLLKHLEGGKSLTRSRIYHLFESSGISAAGQRGIHILWKLAQQGLICFGPHDIRQPTFVLLDEWLPEKTNVNYEAAIATLARSYFSSHGPATVADFAWWAGLTLREAKAAVEDCKPSLESANVETRSYWFSETIAPNKKASTCAHFLPAYDEYLVAYADRTAATGRLKFTGRDNPIFSPTIIYNGKVIGTWKRAIQKQVHISPLPFSPLSRSEQEALAGAGRRYGYFVGSSVMIRYA